MIIKQFNRAIYFLLEKEARLVLNKYKPKVISVVGSDFTTNTGHALFTALSKFYFVRPAGKNVSLNILGFQDGEKTLWEWVLVFIEGLALIILPNHYPEFIIVESKFEGADYIVHVDEMSKLKTKDYEIIYDEQKLPKGITFKIINNDQEFTVLLDDTIGRSQMEPVLKAFDLCTVLGQNLSILSKAFNDLHEPKKGYMKLTKGIKGSVIIDDSLDASIELIVEGVRDLKSVNISKRRIAVIGDILELEKNSIKAHKRIGQEIDEKIEMLVTVGIRARHIAEEALNNGYTESNVFQFDEAGEAGGFIQNLIKAGDVIYVSGSNDMHMEKVVEEIKL